VCLAEGCVPCRESMHRRLECGPYAAAGGCNMTGPVTELRVDEGEWLNKPFVV